MLGYLCENCDRSSIEPICEECQLKELEAWLLDRGYHKINREVILRKIKQVLLATDNNIQEIDHNVCVVCNRPHVFSCPYCFDEISFKVLIKFHAKKHVLENFLRTFNHSPAIRKRLMVSLKSY